jgi:hypothetical protein
MREVDFEPVKECWNTYVLADMTKVKGRAILVKLLAGKLPLFSTSATGMQAQFTPLFHYVFAVSAPLNLKGPPGYPPTQEEVVTARLGRGQPVEIVESNEEWNIYRIVETGETFKVKLAVSDAYRIPKRYGPEGEPIYVFTHATTIVPGPRSNFPRP